MKKASFLTGVFFLSICAVNAQDWEKFKAEDLGFVAYYPNKPERISKKMKNIVGEPKMDTVIYSPENGDDNLLYTVICNKNLRKQFENGDEGDAKILDEAVKGAVSAAEGFLNFDHPVKFNGYPGRSIKIQTDKGFMYMNIYLVENSTYIVQVACMANKDYNDSIFRFLKSFDLIKTK